MFKKLDSGAIFAFMSTDLLERYESTTAGEIRAMAARYMIKNKEIAAYLGVAEMHVSRRMVGRVRWNISEIAALAVFFNCELSDLLPKELPHLDSNQEPSDSWPEKTCDAEVMYFVPRNVCNVRTNLTMPLGHVA